MLDVNNDQLSSELNEDEVGKGNDKTPAKSVEKKSVEKKTVGEDLDNDALAEEAKTTSVEVAESIEDSKEDSIETPEEIKEAPSDEKSETEEVEPASGDVEQPTSAVEKETPSDEKSETEEVEPASVKAKEPAAEDKDSDDADESTVPAAVAASETRREAPKVIPEYDLTDLSLEGIVDLMKQLLNDFEIHDVKHHFENLKTGFQKKFRSFLYEQKQDFIKAGGEESEFFFTSPLKNRFDELINEYKRKRQDFYREFERVQKENLEIRLRLIEELKELIDNAEASTMYKNFRILQEKWKTVGQIPRAKYNDVWKTYHHHVERFYDLLHLNNDFRDLDFKHNLEEKTKLIEKAEALSAQEDVNHAFKELQILHRMWKEDIGPVSRELREEVWHKFSEATKKIHKRRHEYQERLDDKYKANVDLKLAVIEQIRSMDLAKNKNHKDWQDSIKKLDALRDQFFAIGKVPRSKNEEIWQLLRDATKGFNTEKNKFYKNIKKDQSENLSKKLALVEKAEALKDSENWEEATEFYKKVQADWKKIGHVPRRDSDRIWKRFKDACNHYFDRLHEKQNDLNKGESEVIDKKKEFLESIKEEMEEAKELTMDFVDDVQDRWRSLGILPIKMKHLDAKFHKLLDVAYKKLDIDKDQAAFLRFKSTVDSLSDQNNTRKLDSEQLFIRRKIDEITKEIKQLENNISFISNATKDNPLIKNVYKNIEDQKKSLEVWQKKIDYIKKMEY